MNPQQQVDPIRKTRAFLLDIVKDVSIEKLNEIPDGFSNNIIWHLGHMIAAQQGICYVRAGMKPAIPENYILPYKSGTKPDKPVSAEEVENIKQTFFSSLDLLENDLQNNLIANYNSWTTRYGVEITSIDDAIQFLLYHEGLHAGYVTYMKRIING